MHASISAHIANDYLLDDFTGRWGPNLAEFRRRLGNPQAKGYIENLYFTYLFTLRAVQKAAPLLQVPFRLLYCLELPSVLSYTGAAAVHELASLH
jgi:hypothetical protein